MGLANTQLVAKDQWGLTLAMLAAGSGTVPIMRDVLERIKLAEVCARLVAVLSICRSLRKAKGTRISPCHTTRIMLSLSLYGVARLFLTDSCPAWRTDVVPPLCALPVAPLSIDDFNNV